MSSINLLKCKQHLKVLFQHLCYNPLCVFSHKQFQTPALLLLILGAYQVHILNDFCASPQISRGMEYLSPTFLQMGSDA